MKWKVFAIIKMDIDKGIREIKSRRLCRQGLHQPDAMRTKPAIYYFTKFQMAFGLRGSVNKWHRYSPNPRPPAPEDEAIAAFPEKTKEPCLIEIAFGFFSFCQLEPPEPLVGMYLRMAGVIAVEHEHTIHPYGRLHVAEVRMFVQIEPMLAWIEIGIDRVAHDTGWGKLTVEVIYLCSAECRRYIGWLGQVSMFSPPELMPFGLFRSSAVDEVHVPVEMRNKIEIYVMLCQLVFVSGHRQAIFIGADELISLSVHCLPVVSYHADKPAAEHTALMRGIWRRDRAVALIHIDHVHYLFIENVIGRDGVIGYAQVQKRLRHSMHDLSMDSIAACICAVRNYQ